MNSARSKKQVSALRKLDEALKHSESVHKGTIFTLISRCSQRLYASCCGSGVAQTFRDPLVKSVKVYVIDCAQNVYVYESIKVLVKSIQG